MDSLEDANRCIKHLNQLVLEGCYITVEKSQRKRARTICLVSISSLIKQGAIVVTVVGIEFLRTMGTEDLQGIHHRGGRDYSPRHSLNGGKSRRKCSCSPYERSYPRGFR
ncbi:serine/arginine-rich splicing factor SR45a [Capsicum chacoense]|uniref:serine/arginine-rich splicing factor SR45a n=1 Tax=Capsicum annuum TaxID=4072 RepID=UPI0007BF7A89|nr:serine/arginine-rich splicing factor SR45a [Capsicum annuum]